MTSVKKPVDLLNDPIPTALKRMTLPMLVGLMTLISFNLVDTLFVSFLGTEPLAAISFTFPVTFTVISLAIGLGIGTSAVIGKAMGSGNREEAKLDGTGALMLSFMLVALLSMVGYFSTDIIFTLLGAEAELLPMIHQYMDLWFIGSAFLVCPMVGNSVMRAFGDTKTPSMVMGFGAIVNAILDPLLIFGLGPFPEMGLQGAALATLLAWSAGFVLVVYILAFKKKIIHPRLGTLNQFVLTSRKILKIGLPAAGANMLTPIAAAIMTAMVAIHGNAAVGAFGVGSRLESIASLVVLAMSMTLPPFISQNLGAGKMERVIEAYRTTLKFIMVWQLLVYMALIAFAGLIASGFSDDSAVTDVIKLFIWILPLGYGLQGVIILTNSSLNALHLPMSALVMSVIRLFVFYVPFAYVGSHFWGIIGLFVGALLGNVCTSAVSYYWFKKLFAEMAGKMAEDKKLEAIKL
ncbi:MAG: putative MATE family efflux protein [Phenylobacterium sp.]|jgi:putative MATE family efflux protein